MCVDDEIRSCSIVPGWEGSGVGCQDDTHLIDVLNVGHQSGGHLETQQICCTLLAVSTMELPWK